MAKANPRRVRFTQREVAAEPPTESDLRQWKRVGRGPAALAKALQRPVVVLEPEVAKDFASSADVNEALRLVQQLRQVGGKQVRRKKSA